MSAATAASSTMSHWTLERDADGVGAERGVGQAELALRHPNALAVAADAPVEEGPVGITASGTTENARKLLVFAAIDLKWGKNRGKAIQKIFLVPGTVTLPPLPDIYDPASVWALNNRLTDAEPIGLGLVEGPEDVAFDRSGRSADAHHRSRRRHSRARSAGLSKRRLDDRRGGVEHHRRPLRGARIACRAISARRHAASGDRGRQASRRIRYCGASRLTARVACLAGLECRHRRPRSRDGCAQRARRPGRPAGRTGPRPRTERGRPCDTWG